MSSATWWTQIFYRKYCTTFSCFIPSVFWNFRAVARWMVFASLVARVPRIERPCLWRWSSGSFYSRILESRSNRTQLYWTAWEGLGCCVCHHTQFPFSKFFRVISHILVMNFINTFPKNVRFSQAYLTVVSWFFLKRSIMACCYFTLTPIFNANYS